MDKDVFLVHTEHNNDPATEVLLQEPSEDALERIPVVKQMPGEEPLLDRARSPEVRQEDQKGETPFEELAVIDASDQADVVMKAREAHLEVAAQASSHEPWWKRILAGWSAKEKAAETLPEAGSEGP